MRRKGLLCLALFLILLSLVISTPVTQECNASENQDILFEIIESGILSGYLEEAYLIVKTDVEWKIVWENHSILLSPKRMCPEINFSERMVICAFMGQRPTAGYSVSMKRVWDAGDDVIVEIIKSKPPENATVAQVLTSPYIFASLEMLHGEIVFRVTEEDGTKVEYVLPEFHMLGLAFTSLFIISVCLAASQLKSKRNRFEISKQNSLQAHITFEFNIIIHSSY